MLIFHFLHILTDFKNATPRLNLAIFWIKTAQLCIIHSVIVVNLLKISSSSDNSNVLKTSSIEDRGHLFLMKQFVLAAFSVVFFPLKIDKMIVFDNLICHPYYRTIQSYAVSALDFFFFSVNL